MRLLSERLFRRLEDRIRRVIEVVITSRTRNAVVLYGARGFESHTLRASWVRNSLNIKGFGLFFILVKLVPFSATFGAAVKNRENDPFLCGFSCVTFGEIQLVEKLVCDRGLNLVDALLLRLQHE